MNLVAVWQALELRQRLVVLMATLSMFAAVYALTAVAMRPSLALLYAGVDGSRSGEVLVALDQRGVRYEVKGQAIYVESARRDALRMELAAEGLPANSGAGYELLDGLSGFGTTSQMFDAAYWRAKEGELARTIAALPTVRTVRVHISNTEPQGFRSTAAPKAAVTVVTRDGRLSTEQARALRYLVSSAVAGMTPGDVAVIDGAGNLIRAVDGDPGQIGADRAADLREKVLRLIEARVGPGKAVVEVSVETVTESEAVTETTFDPQGRVAISSESEEQSASSNDQGAGAVTVASNLPAGNAADGGRSSQSTDSQTRERINYEVGETRREIVRAAGGVRRVTVAVLVDGQSAAQADGTVVLQPRPEEELSALRDLVSAAVGLDETRGDVVTVRTLAFEPVPEAGAEAGASVFDGLTLDMMTLIQLGVLAIVSLVLGLFVVRPILASRTHGRPIAALAGPSPDSILTGEIDDGTYLAASPPDVRMPRTIGEDREPPDPAADPADRLRRLIAERQEDTVTILKRWIDSPATEKV